MSGEVIVPSRTVIDIVDVGGTVYQRTTTSGYKGGQNPDGSPKITESYDSIYLGRTSTLTEQL